MLVEPAYRFDHAARLLRRRRIVEIDERVAVDRPAQDREIVPNLLQVEERRQRFAVLPRLRFEGRNNAQGFLAFEELATHEH
jgi:hypothetical protein